MKKHKEKENIYIEIYLLKTKRRERNNNKKTLNHMIYIYMFEKNYNIIRTKQNMFKSIEHMIFCKLYL